MANARQLEPKKWILQSYKNGIRKTFRGTSRGEVEKAERDWLNDLETYGKELKNDKVKLSSLIYENLFVNIKPNVSMGTFERYMSTYNTHIKDADICNKDIKNITQVDIKRMLNSKAHLSQSSLKNIYIVLNGGFTHAINDNIVRINVMNGLQMPKSTYKSKRTIDSFTQEEQEKYLKIVSSTQYIELIIVALCTGMRQGELTALKWVNVDLNKNIIKVVETKRSMRTYDNDGNFEDKIVTCDPKTKKSNRVIPISKEISNMLKKLKLKNGASNDDFVFISKKNEPIKNDTLSKMHKIFCKKAGVKVINFHGLRHTFATQSIRLGVNVKTLSEILGHSDVSITLNKYVHTDQNEMRQAVEKVSKLISTL